MKKLLVLALLLTATAALASNDKKGISISFSSEDSRTHLGPRLNVRDARLAITNHDGSVSLLLMNDVVAVQLTDRALANISTKDDASFIEELLASGVRTALRKAVEYPISGISSAGIRDGALVLTNDKGQPVFTEVKVNGTDVLRDFAIGDAARFVNAFRAVKSGR
jgi:hypothetical protein